MEILSVCVTIFTLLGLSGFIHSYDALTQRNEPAFVPSIITGLYCGVVVALPIYAYLGVAALMF